MRRFDVSERRARLSRRHRLAPGHRASAVEDAAASVIGLHGTDTASIHLAAWARVDGFERDELDRALVEERTLVRHLCMRRTLFVLPVDLLDDVQAGVADRVASAERRRLAKDVERAGLHPDGEAWLAAAEEEAYSTLAVHGPATWSELRELAPLLGGTIVVAPGKAYGAVVPVGPRVLAAMSAGGRIVRGPSRGSWTTARPAWATMDAWVGRDLARPAPRAALARLVERWLRAFGPATVDDVRWWLGSTLTAVRAALRDIGAVEVDLDGRPGIALADDLAPEEPVEPYAALLPGLDPTSMGWTERAWYLGPHGADLIDRNGNIGPTAWWDGRMVGGWAQDSDGVVVVQPLEPLRDDALSALAGEAQRLTEWLDGARVPLRFASPLARRGVATG